MLLIHEHEPFLFKCRSFPLHFDENSFFAGDKNEAHKLKVINYTSA